MLNTYKFKGLFTIIASATIALVTHHNVDYYAWAVDYNDSVYYHLSESITSDLEGVDYLCIVQENESCVITSYALPDYQGRIRIEDAIAIKFGNFVDLNPAY
ncbi:hypothetical protein SAMN04488122_0862 [Chitinophaga arvensicola]|uniref:Uncharacterized protein n=1 Tax=Chitinophaga arvensicola TaxID=29529 RepID=A0A1I0PME7_9BACT|nr:hypothetical protein SAMN04488122_0862 [Chitinophaga arvensicola]